jgi:hypothetical protein
MPTLFCCRLNWLHPPFLVIYCTMGEHSSDTPCYTWKRKSKKEVGIVCTFLALASDGGGATVNGVLYTTKGHEHSSLSLTL